jgi:hypothetical protein
MVGRIHEDVNFAYGNYVVKSAMSALLESCLRSSGTGRLVADRGGRGREPAPGLAAARWPGAARWPHPRTVAVQPGADATAGLADRAASGGLILRVAETLPLERFRGEYTRLERGGLPGKIVLTP